METAGKAEDWKIGNDRCIEVWMYGGIETTERQLKGLRCPSGIYFIDSGSSPE